MKTIIRFIKEHPFYFSGYGVTTLSYFGRYVHGFEGDIVAQAALFVLSGFIGLASWLYIAARFVNAICG